MLHHQNIKNMNKYQLDIELFLGYRCPGVAVTEDLSFEVEFSDEEVARIRQLVKDYTGDKEAGLMPILQDDAPELHERISKAAFQEIHDFQLREEIRNISIMVDEDEEPHLVILRGKDNQTGLVTITNPRFPQSGNGIDAITTPDRIYSWQKWKSINNNLTLGKNDSYNLTYGGNFPKGMLTKKVLKGGIMGLVVNLDLLPMGSEIYYIEETSQDKSLLLTLSTFRKEEDEFVQCRYVNLSAFPGKSRVAVGDEIINPVRYSYVELAGLMTDLEMQNHDNDGGPNDETLDREWIIATAPTFVELDETIPVGVASDGALVDPEDDEALYVEDHEILLDCSDIIRVIIEDTRSYGVPIRYKTSASYRESHNG